MSGKFVLAITLTCILTGLIGSLSKVHGIGTSQIADIEANQKNYHSMAKVAYAQVNNHRMALSISSDGKPIEGNIYWKGGWFSAQFTTEDEKAYVWMNITLDKEETITAEWRFPNGTVHQTDEITLDIGIHCLWFSINIEGHPIAQVRGGWEVEAFANSAHLFTEEFSIVQAPTFPWDTILSITGMIATAIAAPILFAFLRMKKQPSKISFTLLLIGGLLIAISGFFRGALGGEAYIYGIGFAMAFLVFGIFVPLVLGTVISISALTSRRVLVLILPVTSLLYFAVFYPTLISEETRLYIVPFALAMIGVICSILGGILIRRKA